MPVYEYSCPKCGVIEAMQKITDDPLSKCPECRRKVKRLISLNNFHLKGSGWYVTDYAGKNGNGKQKEKESDTSTATTTTTATTAAPATTAKTETTKTETKSKTTETKSASAD